MFTEQTLRKGLKTHLFGKKIYTFQDIDSTNNCAKAVAACGAQEGTIVIAEEQTAGRGRLGRMWQANPNENLMFSIVLRPKVPPEELNLLPLYVAVGVAEAVERSTKLKVECKWPNDLMLNKKKFAGILIEGSIKKNVVEHVVIGVGINVNQQMFRGELEQKATSIKLETGREMDRAMLFRETLISLEKNYNLVSSKKGHQLIVPRWVSRSTMINRPISVSQHGNLISGVVKGLSTDGGLILQSNGTEKILSASDVTIVGM